MRICLHKIQVWALHFWVILGWGLQPVGLTTRGPNNKELDESAGLQLPPLRAEGRGKLQAPPQANFLLIFLSGISWPYDCSHIDCLPEEQATRSLLRVQVYCCHHSGKRRGSASYSPAPTLRP